MLTRILEFVATGIILFLTIEDFTQGNYWMGVFGASILIGIICLEYSAWKAKAQHSTSNPFLLYLVVVLFVLKYAFGVTIGLGLFIALLVIAILLDGKFKIEKETTE
jgi:hypothetical protein